jgi:hypothetical protein
MAKQYEFFFSFFASGPNGTSVSNTFLSFDHKSITAKDIENAELDFVEKSQGLFSDANIISYVFNKVTGNFDYRFLVHLTKNNGVEILAAYDMLFDHLITTETMHDDYLSFKDFFFKDKDKSKRIRSLEILLHFENQTE